ncbi:hypothetical protein C8J57DRAFT_1244151 [Mycena rebaudengoi]|nr:hypothetical protein C8J57DRAFT_1244151 [Mycena rebaudengoi]
MGHDLKAAILLGRTENYINVSNELHIHFFHWLWFRIVQNAVNQFVRYWNTHKTRKQSSKYLPSGVAPEEVFQHPENFGLRHAGIPADLNVPRERGREEGRTPEMSKASHPPPEAITFGPGHVKKY